MQEVINRRDQNRSNFEEAIEDVRHFTEDFMQVEKDLLLKAGLTEEADNALIDEGRRLRDSIRNSREHSASILRNIVTLQQQVCDAAAQMIDVERAKSTLKRAFLGIGGALIVGVNVSADLLAFLTPVGTAISGAFGSGLIGNAVTL